VQLQRGPSAGMPLTWRTPSARGQVARPGGAACEHILAAPRRRGGRRRRAARGRAQPGGVHHAAALAHRVAVVGGHAARRARARRRATLAVRAWRCSGKSVWSMRSRSQLQYRFTFLAGRDGRRSRAQGEGWPALWRCGAIITGACRLSAQVLYLPLSCLPRLAHGDFASPRPAG